MSVGRLVGQPVKNFTSMVISEYLFNLVDFNNFFSGLTRKKILKSWLNIKLLLRLTHTIQTYYHQLPLPMPYKLPRWNTRASFWFLLFLVNCCLRWILMRFSCLVYSKDLIIFLVYSSHLGGLGFPFSLFRRLWPLQSGMITGISCPPFSSCESEGSEIDYSNWFISSRGISTSVMLH